MVVISFSATIGLCFFWTSSPPPLIQSNQLHCNRRKKGRKRLTQFTALPPHKKFIYGVKEEGLTRLVIRVTPKAYSYLLMSANCNKELRRFYKFVPTFYPLRTCPALSPLKPFAHWYRSNCLFTYGAAQPDRSLHE